MARKIVVTSGKGGVGKPTVTANLGVQLAKNGCRVVVCDLDFGLNNVDVVLGVENLASFDVIDAIEAVLGRRPEVRFLPGRPVDVPVNVLDVSRYETDFGPLCPLPLEEGIRRLAEFYGKGGLAPCR